MSCRKMRMKPTEIPNLLLRLSLKRFTETTLCIVSVTNEWSVVGSHVSGNTSSSLSSEHL